jgi:hypothetical protein
MSKVDFSKKPTAELELLLIEYQTVPDVRNTIISELEKRRSTKELIDLADKRAMKCMTKWILGFTVVAAIAGVIAVGIALFELCK